MSIRFVRLSIHDLTLPNMSCMDTGSCGTDYLNDFFVLDTDPPPQMKVTEPPSPQLYASRVRHFYNDEEFSDVTFLVEGRSLDTSLYSRLCRIVSVPCSWQASVRVPPIRQRLKFPTVVIAASLR